MDTIICGEPLGPRVSAVSPIEGYRLLLTFNNGECRMFDAKALFALSVFKALQNKAFFESVKVANGSILWPNGIDYCPDTLYAESTAIR